MTIKDLEQAIESLEATALTMRRNFEAQVSALHVERCGLETRVLALNTECNQALRQRDRALRVLKDIEDFVSDECDGAEDSHDPLKHVGALLADYAHGDIPSPSLHTRCTASLRGMIERALKAEENERVMRKVLDEFVSLGSQEELTPVLEAVRLEADAALVRPGRHAGPYTVKVYTAGGIDVDVYTSLDTDADSHHPDPERLADIDDMRRDAARDRVSRG